jgi:hypothetical protein
MKMKNKYEDSPTPFFSALIGSILGDPEADEYLEEN